MGRRNKSAAQITGRLSRHPDGYGFVIPDGDSRGEDVYIPARSMADAADGDRVRVRVLPARKGRGHRTGKSRKGEITEVLARGRDAVVGRILRLGPEVCVAPLDQRYHYIVHLSGEVPKEIEEGTIVVASIQVQPAAGQPPLGELSEVLGAPDAPDIQYKIVCHSVGIPMEFPAGVLAEAEAAAEPDQAALASRLDLRDLPTVTIDGETARDFDDAVSIESRPQGGWRLWVHIADVSHYVADGSRLDAEARRRGTSVYFPDRAIPMLPEKLSNELCSLNPGVDRLTVTVVMDIDGKGRVTTRDVQPSVIRSNERMTYTDVQKIVIDRDEDLRRRHVSLVGAFQSMLELARVLAAKRREQGSIDFDLPEAEIEYDPEGEVLDIVRAERNQAHRIIEEFMLAANHAVAAHLEGRNLPLIYRIHEAPDDRKVEEFLDIAVRFGHGLEADAGGRYSPRSFQKLARRLADRPEGRFLVYLMLRSFKQARYSEVNHGHFGLASSCYTHFTSPIRRYPDLIVHRILKAALSDQHESPGLQDLFAKLSAISELSSEREQKAVDAERRIMRWLMAEFMAERLGEEYDAFIIGVRHNGFFVELLDHFVEGFVPVETILDDYYVFDRRHHRLIGERSRNVFRIGDQLTVRVDKVSPDRHLIDFSPVSRMRSGKTRKV